MRSSDSHDDHIYIIYNKPALSSLSINQGVSINNIRSTATCLRNILEGNQTAGINVWLVGVVETRETWGPTEIDLQEPEIDP
jgi:hypothetical protein